MPQTQTALTSPSSATGCALSQEVDRYFDPTHRGWCFPTWAALHAIADAFPDKPSEDDQTRIRTLMDMMGYLLPCNICSQHLRQKLQQSPVDASSGIALSRWMVDLHNRVNESLHKPQLSFDDAMAEQRWIRSLNWANVVTDLRHNAHFSHGWRYATRPAPAHSDFFKGRKAQGRHAGAAAPSRASGTVASPGPGSWPVFALLLLLAAAVLAFLVYEVVNQHRTGQPERPQRRRPPSHHAAASVRMEEEDATDSFFR